jgi:hypothetical protein
MGISFVLCGLSATNRCELTQGSSVLLCKLSLADAVGRERFFTEIAEIYASGSTFPHRSGRSSTPGITSTWFELQVRVGVSASARTGASVPTDSRAGRPAARGRCWILDARSPGPVTCGHERLRRQSTQSRGQRGSSHASEVHVPWNRTRLGVAFGAARDVGKRRAPIAGANRHNAAAASTCQTA